MKFPPYFYETASRFGLTPFVSLWHLEHALSELFRVLAPGGKLFAFQDIIPNDPQMAEQLVKRGLVPHGQNTCYSTGTIADTKFLKALDRDLAATLSTTGAGYPVYLEQFNALMVMQNVYEYLHFWLINEMKYAGFGIAYAGFEKVFNVVPRRYYHAYEGRGRELNRDVIFRFQCVEDGPFHRTFVPGVSRNEIYDAIGPNNVLQYSIIWAVIGEKPAV